MISDGDCGRWWQHWMVTIVVMAALWPCHRATNISSVSLKWWDAATLAAVHNCHHQSPSQFTIHPTHKHTNTRSSTALISHPHNWLLIGHNWRRSAQMSPECRMSPCVSVLESDTDSVVLSKHAELTPTLPIHGQHWNVIYTELLLPQ